MSSMCSSDQYSYYMELYTLKSKSKRKDIVIGTKLYKGFAKKDLKAILTDTCKKCKHLIDDHHRPLEAKDSVPFVCECGCKIK